MGKWITKLQILDLAKGKNFRDESEFRDYVAKKIGKLLCIKESQISIEPNTTSFDYTLSNRADIVVRTDDNFRKAILVIELKLTKSIDKYYGGNLEAPLKQLHKYSQDTRAPYGILLTEISCTIYKNKYFAYDQVPKKVEAERIPPIDSIEDTMAFYALLDFILYKKSTKYLVLLIVFFSIFGLMLNSITSSHGVLVSALISFTITFVTGAVLLIMAKIFKIFE